MTASTADALTGGFFGLVSVIGMLLVVLGWCLWRSVSLWVMTKQPDPRHPSQYVLSEKERAAHYEALNAEAKRDACRICVHPMRRHDWVEDPNTGNGDFFCQDCSCDGSPCLGMIASGVCCLPLGHKEPCR